MHRPVHFEICSDDPEKCAAFYEAVLGWKTATWDGGEQKYWMVTTGEEGSPGIDGGIMGRHFEQSVINTVMVEDLQAMIAKVEEHGGKLAHGPNEVPNVGLHAYCSDPEGNLVGLMQPKG